MSRDDYQPVLVLTKLAQKVPLWIRTALGTKYSRPASYTRNLATMYGFRSVMADYD